MEERRTEDRDRLVKRVLDLIAPNLLLERRADVKIERRLDDRGKERGIRPILKRQTLRRDFQRRALVVFNRLS